MELRKIKKEMSIFLAIVSIIQIVLIINTIYAQSYFFSEENYSNKKIEESDFEKLRDFGLDFLVYLFSIKQIGSVSAAIDDGLVCCSQLKESEGGALCQNIANIDEEINRCKSGSLYQTTCENTQECAIGVCVVEEGESCLSNSPKAACEAGENSVWKDTSRNSLQECRKGCCVVGNNANLRTQTQCEGENGEFIDGINNEFSCSILAENLLEGACVTDDGTCRLRTGIDCRKTRGDFFAGTLCSNPELENLGVQCERQDHTGSVDGKDEIFWFDSCGNRENIYDANRERSWNNGMILSKAQSCNPNSANKNSQTCGNCNSNLGSFVSETDIGETSIQDGNFVCKNLDCNVELDLNGDGDTNDAGESYVKKNGESWCIYEGSIGKKSEGGDEFSSDAVGSEHWRAECIDGEVSKNICGQRREKVCSEKTSGDSDFTVAQCQENEADICLNNNPLQDSNGISVTSNVNACNQNSHCMIKSVAVDDYFSFDVCVPRYPKGTDLKEPSLADTYCQYGDADCTVIYRKEFDGEWDCVENCNCESAEFSKQMNNLCVSLGDCGNYVNFKGEGTNDGVRISQLKGAKIPSEYPYTNYGEYSKPNQGEAVPPKEYDFGDIGVGDTQTIEQFDVSKIEEIEEFCLGTNCFVIGGPETLNKILTLGGVLGGTYGESPLKAIGVGGLLTWIGAGIASGGVFVGVQTPFFFLESGAFSFAPELTIGSFGLATAGAVVGALVGQAIAENYGITGPAATVITVSGGVAGGAVAYNLAIDAATTFGGATFWVAVGIIVFVVVTGWGESEERTLSFDCRPWQAPSGGENCDLCNEGDLRCTKYKCESLGQACTLLNANTDNPICESIRFESNPPVLSAGKVQTEGFSFEGNNFDSNRQISIKSEIDSNGCIQEYTPVEFTIESDEFAQCRYAFEKTRNYEEMPYWPLEENYHLKNRTFGISGIGLSALDYLEVSGNIRNGFTGDLNIHIRCKDYHGNFNEPEYVVNYCLNSGPDKTPVAHAYTTAEPENRRFLPYGTEEKDITLWINEPAQCRYSLNPGTEYNQMTNEMECGTHPINDHGLRGWPCRTELTDLKSENRIYVKCKDQPWPEISEEERNVNEEDYEYIVRVTENPLKIDSIRLTLDYGDRQSSYDLQSSNTEISAKGVYSHAELEVETLGGSENGIAFCKYEFTNQPQFSETSFAETGENFHRQIFTGLQSGNKDLKISCVDSAGNLATNSTEFDLTVDSSAPRIVRAYNQNNRLKLITNEDAKCFYGNDRVKGCGFDINNASSMSSLFSTTHSVDWDSGKTYYVRCTDLFDNTNPSCAITVNPA